MSRVVGYRKSDHAIIWVGPDTGLTQPELDADLPSRINGATTDTHGLFVTSEDAVNCKDWEVDDSGEDPIVVEKSAPDYIVLTTDATDTYVPFDGISDIVADGVSSCNITIQKKDGTTNEDKTGTETLYITTTHGVLSTQNIDLVGGSGSFTLTSVVETVIADINVFDPSGNLKEGKIRIQFVPSS